MIFKILIYYVANFFPGPPPKRESFSPLDSPPHPQDYASNSITRYCPTSEPGEMSIPSTPVASTSYLPQSSIHPPSTPNPQYMEGHPFSKSSFVGPYIRPSPSPSLTLSFPTSTSTKEALDYIQGLKFTVNINGPFPHIEKLFPSLPEYVKSKEKNLIAYFVLIPEYKCVSKEEYEGNPYCSEEEIDLSDFLAIHTISPSHIFRVNDNPTKHKAKVRCRLNSWVSIGSSIFL